MKQGSVRWHSIIMRYATLKIIFFITITIIICIVNSFPTRTTAKLQCTMKIFLIGEGSTTIVFTSKYTTNRVLTNNAITTYEFVGTHTIINLIINMCKYHTIITVANTCRSREFWLIFRSKIRIRRSTFMMRA